MLMPLFGCELLDGEMAALACLEVLQGREARGGVGKQVASTGGVAADGDRAVVDAADDPMARDLQVDGDVVDRQPDRVAARAPS